MLRSVIMVLPVLTVVTVWYTVTDPYKVLRHYDNYITDYKEESARIGINKGLITFTNFSDRRAEGHEYNAFIFGSSISCYYDAYAWASLLEKNRQNDNINDGKIEPYHFDSSNETLTAMARKVNYLDENNIAIRYALVVLDPIIMGNEDIESPAYVDPPQEHDNIFETIKYHYTFFRAAVNADFLKSWIPAQITGKPVNNGRNRIFEEQPIVYDPITNQETLPEWDIQIKKSPQEFYAEHKLIPAAKELKESKPVISAEKEQALREIAVIFKAHNTSYQILIGPNRAKVTLNSKDLTLLRNIFGNEHVHDFSSDMAYILESDTMLYDNTHYRPCVAQTFMECIYSVK